MKDAAGHGGRSLRRLLGIGASCAAILSCAELLDIPDDPVLVDQQASRVPAQSNEQTLVPDDDRKADSEVDGEGLARGTDGEQGVPTPSRTSTDPPPLIGSPSDGAVDAGVDPGERDADAAADGGDSLPDGEGQTACAGQRLFGICWYLGAAGESCEQACSTHGGYAAAATEHTGVRAQGGSPADCTAILGVLGSNVPARPAVRLDGVGIGCHTFGAIEAPFWLSFPSFDPSARLGRARVACGCVE